MGATVVRAQTLGISTGNSLSVEPSLGEFNPAAFDTIDYSVYRAGQLGLRLNIPLTNYWNYSSAPQTMTPPGPIPGPHRWHRRGTA